MSRPTRKSAAPRRALVGLGAFVILFYSLAPIIWIFIASITPELKADFDRAWLSNRQVTYLPAEPTLSNYVALFDVVPFGIYFRNSTIIATGNMLQIVKTAKIAVLFITTSTVLHFAHTNRRRRKQDQGRRNVPLARLGYRNVHAYSFGVLLCDW